MARANRSPAVWAALIAPLAAALAAAAPAAARTADRLPPRIVAAKTADRDADGHIDAIAVRYSENVRLRKGAGRPRLIVKGYAIESVRKGPARKCPAKLRKRRRCPKAKTDTLILTLKERGEKDAFDTDATPAVAYSRARPKGRRRPAKIVDSAANEAFAGIFRGTDDGAGPLLLEARTLDDDGDGHLDTVRATFSEPMTFEGSTGRELPLKVAGMKVFQVSPAEDEETIEAGVEEGPLADTGARPKVSVDPSVAGPDLADGAGNPVAEAASVTPGDRAPPILTGAVTADGGGVTGAVDRVDLSFSEPVEHPADSDGTYPLAVAGQTIRSVGAAAGATGLAIAVAEGGIDTGIRPTVAYRSGQGAAIEDTAGNELRERHLDGIRDGVPPLLLSARTADADGNGRIDRLVATFSEALGYGGSAGGGPFSVAGYPVASTDPAAGREVTVRLAEGAGFDTGARPPLFYAPSGASGVADGSGQVAPAGSVAQPGDGAAPVLVAAATGDANANGRIDRIEALFSEGVGHPADSDGSYPISLSDGYAISGAGLPALAGGTSMSVPLSERSSADTGAAPALGYATASSGAIADAAGNQPPAKTYSGLTRDDAAPQLLTVQTADSNGNGKIDQVVHGYSESVQVTGQPFAIGGYAAPSASASGASVTVSLTEAGSADTGATPTSTYTDVAGAGPVTDSANPAASDQPNDAPSASRTATDGAAPAIVAAATRDTGTANGKLDRLDLTFSEAVSHPADSDGTYPLSLSGGYAIGAAGLPSLPGATTMQVPLQEQSLAANTGDTSALPAPTYASASSGAITDATGAQLAAKTFAGVTADGAAPHLFLVKTADADSDGKLDGVQYLYSETVSVAGQPYDVTGYTETSASVSGATVTVNVTELATCDTSATPSATVGSGNVTDSAANAAAADTRGASDYAGPAIADADTKDSATANGKIDKLTLELSEAVTHDSQASGPFPLSAQGRTVSAVSAPNSSGNGVCGVSGTNRYIDVTIAESSAYDTGDKPPVSHTGEGTKKIEDASAAKNQPPSASKTPDDTAAPLLVAALAKDTGTANGKIDTFATTWSEPITHEADTGASYPFSVANPSRTVSGTIAAVTGSVTSTLDVPITEASSADRDKAPDIVYTAPASNEQPVLDVTGNAASTKTITGTSSPAAVTRICADPTEDNTNDNDSSGAALAVSAGRRSEQICGGDDDWFSFSLTTTPSPTFRVLVQPASTLNTHLTLWASDGTTAQTVSSNVDGAAGAADSFTFTVPSNANYLLKVTGDSFVDGSYCLATTTDGNAPLCGAQAGEVIITEVMGANGSSGVADFVEVYNRSGIAQDLTGFGLDYSGDATLECTLQADASSLTIANGDRLWGATSSGDFKCASGGSLSIPNEGVNIKLRNSSTTLIDNLPNLPLAANQVQSGHSIETKASAESGLAETSNDALSGWCYTYFDANAAASARNNAPDTKGEAGDGCDEYRLHELNWNAPDADNGKTFIELRGNGSLAAGANLLEGWHLVYIEGKNTGPTPRPAGSSAGDIDTDLALPAGADPGADGVYVIGDASGGVSTVSPAPDVLFENGDPEDDIDSIQLLRAGVPSNSCGSGQSFLADSFGHTVGAGLDTASDTIRGCNMFETSAFVDPATAQKTAQRKSGGLDLGDNSTDFETLAQPGTPGTP